MKLRGKAVHLTLLDPVDGSARTHTRSADLRWQEGEGMKGRLK